MSSVPAPASPPPAADLEAFCLRVLQDGALAVKLAPPTDAAGKPLPDTPSGPPIEIDRPARAPGIMMRSGGDALPPPTALAGEDARRLCLSRFAHHELQAVEYFAWALLRWPDAPRELRRGLLVALTDEQRHCRLYLDRLSALGGDFETDDHSDYFWRQADAIAASPAGLRAFLSAMGLTLEQANLDFTLTYRDAFAAVGDDESAAICQVVHDDEVGHVALAARWLGRLGRDPKDSAEGEARATCTLDDYLETVPFPLGPARAKGRRFEVAPRRRAGLPEALIEHVRRARVQDRDASPIPLLANLGAEEDDGPRAANAYAAQGHVRTAAHLFSLLFSRRARLHPDSREAGAPLAQSALWSDRLGASPSQPIFDFLDPAIDPKMDPTPIDGAPRAFAWLNTEAAAAWAEQLGTRLAGPAPHVVRTVHDKAFAIRESEMLRLQPRSLRGLACVVEPDECAAPETTIPRLAAQLAQWPDWTGRRYTLKPRFGSSGRGRFGGEGTLDLERTARALARLARRGGAIFEPWLERDADLSVALHVAAPGADDDDAPPIRLLGSLALWTSASGVYRGHAGEIDSRGRVFSGDVDDESMRADAATLAERARAEGFHGPCGVDGFRYREGERARLRPVVEFNARPTMGLVAIGLVRRALALPRIRKRLAIAPGDRQGFAMSFRAADDDDWRSRIYRHVGRDALILDLAAASRGDDPRAGLVFARDPGAIRDARSDAFGC